MFAQTYTTSWLDSIEKNNNALLKYRQLQNVQEKQWQAENTLPDLLLSGFYLPFGAHNTPDYLEFQVSQDVEFPRVYEARREMLNKEMTSMDLEYARLRQETLLEAQLQIILWQTLKKELHLKQERISILNERSGAQGKLADAKARVRALEQKHDLKALQGKIEEAKNKLEQLNGGRPLPALSEEERLNLDPLSLEQIWPEFLSNDPRVMLLKQERELAQQKLTVERAENLPGLTAGYNYQGIPGNNYHGFYAGLSIPLWSAGSKLDAARASMHQSEFEIESEISSYQARLRILVQEHNRALEEYLAFLNLNTDFQDLQEIQSTYKVADPEATELTEALEFYFENQLRLLFLHQKVWEQRAEIFQYQL